MDWPFDVRPLPPGKSNPHNEFGAPAYAPGGQLPWGQVERAVWTPGAMGTWTYRTPIFDLRPEYNIRADTVVSSAVPVNHQGMYGLGNVLQVIIGGQPANQPGLTVEWWELGDTVGGGNPATALNQLPLLMLARPSDMTTEMLAGGITVAGEGDGGTLFQFTPPGCRFWQVVLRFSADTAIQPVPALYARATLGV